MRERRDAPPSSSTVMRPPGSVGGDQAARPLQRHHVDVVLAHVLLERRGELRALGVPHRHEVLDRHRVEHLSPEALGDDAGAHALAGGVDRRCCAGGSATDDQHVEGVLGVDVGGRPRRGPCVEHGDDLFDGHAATGERVAAAEHGRHRHHATLLGLVLEHGAVDGDVADVRVQHADDVEGLHHVGAVLAGEREERLEVVGALDRPDLLGDVVGDAGRVTADVEEREHERRELVAERDAGERDLHRRAHADDVERRHPDVRAVTTDGHEFGQRRDLVEQAGEVGRLGRFVERCDELDRMTERGEVLAQLLRERGIEHGVDLPEGGVAAASWPGIETCHEVSDTS